MSRKSKYEEQTATAETTTPAEGQTTDAPPATAATAVNGDMAQPRRFGRPKGSKRPGRNPTLCYILLEVRPDGKVGRAYGSKETRGRAKRHAEALIEAGVIDPAKCGIYRAVRV